MTAWFRLLTAVAFCTAGSIVTASAEKRIALVIGNSQYQSVPKLPNPVNDAKGVADLFKKAGFDVVESQSNLNGAQLRRAIRDFTNLSRDADVAVVFFAGHGMEVGGVNYLIPVDAKLSSDIDVEDEAVSLDRVVRALEPAKRLRLVILDACRDNPFMKSMQRTVATRAVTRGLAQVEPAGTDTLIAFAAKAGSTADDGAGRNSPFTAALLKHIPEPGLDVRIAFGRVRDEVLRSTSNRQEPFVYGSLGGSTLALVPAAAAPEPVTRARSQSPATADIAIDRRRDYELAAQIGTKEAWDSFLALQSDGFYADLARAARAKVIAAERAEVGAATANARADAAEKNRASNAGAERAKADAAKAAAAEAQRAKAEALDRAKAEAERSAQDLKVAALPRSADPDLVRELQSELKRTGCYTGTVDGNWNTASRNSLSNFNRHAGLKLDISAAHGEAIEAVKEKTSRVCPLTCAQGYKVEGETCVALPRHAAPPPKARHHAREAREARPSPRPARRGGCVGPADSSTMAQSRMLNC